MGTFFVLPVYLQVMLGLNALDTGIKLLPMSITMFLAALFGPRIAARRSPKVVARLGFVFLAIGSTVLLGTVDITLASVPFALGLAIFGIGIGLLASQLGNVIMSSVDPAQTNQAGGLQGTAQNLGASLGTALIGAILLGALTTGFVDNVEHNDAIAPDVQTAVADAAAATGLQVIPVAEVTPLLVGAGVPQADAELITQDYANAQLYGLKVALFAVALFSIGSSWFTRKLPGHEPAADLSEVLGTPA
jgi:Na+/melibiose symporter-like transporter